MTIIIELTDWIYNSLLNKESVTIKTKKLKKLLYECETNTITKSILYTVVLEA